MIIWMKRLCDIRGYRRGFRRKHWLRNVGSHLFRHGDNVNWIVFANLELGRRKNDTGNMSETKMIMIVSRVFWACSLRPRSSGDMFFGGERTLWRDWFPVAVYGGCSCAWTIPLTKWLPADVTLPSDFTRSPSSGRKQFRLHTAIPPSDSYNVQNLRTELLREAFLCESLSFVRATGIPVVIERGGIFGDHK